MAKLSSLAVSTDRPKPIKIPKVGYTIGITIFVKAGGDYAFFNNGLRQNVLFLYHLFKAAPGCARVLLLNHGPGEPPPLPSSLGVDAATIVRTRDVLDLLDYVIVIGGAVERDELRALRERGCKLVLYKGGNGAVISMESVIVDPPKSSAETYYDYDCYDEIWMTPQHIATYRPWCETIYRCQVHEVPQIWSPIFLQTMDKRVRAEFGYKPGRRQWRTGILDPNTTVMKTSHLPMLVCEAAHRRAPHMLEAVLVSNALPFKENDHFKAFAARLQITRDGLLSVEDRFISWVFLNDWCDAVVTHQWENGLNYLYYDVLFGNYPLIYNSSFLKDYGYYYEDFDAESGAQALIRARLEHDNGLEDYASHHRQLFARLDPTNAWAVGLHERLLLGLRDG